MVALSPMIVELPFWLEQRIRRYEHRRWTTDDNRRVLPFAWGLEHIGGRADDPHPQDFLNRWADRTLADSAEWFAAEPASDYRLLDENSGHTRVLTFYQRRAFSLGREQHCLRAAVCCSQDRTGRGPAAANGTPSGMFRQTFAAG